jgi:hypothetical protein
LARIILNGSTDLIAGVSVERAQRALQSLCDKPDGPRTETLQRHVRRVIEEEIGHKVVEMQRIAETRWMRLVLMGEKAWLQPKPRAYLEQVVKCYLFGFDTECIIMCRSAIESMFRQVVPPELCKARSRKLGLSRPDYSLDARIKIAQEEDMVDPGLCCLAWHVKDDCNKLVHPDRDSDWVPSEEELDTDVQKTVRVVAALAR